MTVEELKLEAKKLGYNIIKIPPKPVKLLPCVCGRKRIDSYATYNTDTKESGYIYKCTCGLRSDIGKTIREAKAKWNERVERAKANEISS